MAAHYPRAAGRIMGVRDEEDAGCVFPPFTWSNCPNIPKLVVFPDMQNTFRSSVPKEARKGLFSPDLGAAFFSHGKFPAQVTREIYFRKTPSSGSTIVSGK
jgi:hypothetical protein